MKAIGNKIGLVDRGSFTILMVMCLKENGKMIWLMEEGFIFMSMELDMKEIEKMTCKMDSVSYFNSGIET